MPCGTRPFVGLDGGSGFTVQNTNTHAVQIPDHGTSWQLRACTWERGQSEAAEQEAGQVGPRQAAMQFAASEQQVPHEAMP